MLESALNTIILRNEVQTTENLTLYWSDPIRFQHLEEEYWDEVLFERGIYIVVGGRKVIYIGQTYDQNFGARLRQHMNSTKWKCIKRAMRRVPSANPFIKCGVLGETCSWQRIRDIEDFLIWVIEPACNYTSYASYTGRRPLKVRNRGNPWPLEPNYYTEDYAHLLM